MRTAILLGAALIAKAINGFGDFPTEDALMASLMVTAMLVWDLFETKIKG